MQVENTFIAGLKVIRLNRFTDQRGCFIKVFNTEIFNAHNLETGFKESYFSVSAKNVIRGMHFQVPPFEHTKLVFVNQGSILDVVLDLRKNSETYGKFFSITINEENPVALYIPIGCAHGFKSLENDTMVSYMQTSVYNKESDSGIHWNSFGMEWKTVNPLLSDRDNNFISFTDYNTVF